MSKLSRMFTVVIGLATGGFFLWLALRDVQLDAVALSLKSANIWLVIPFVGSLSLFYWLKAVRWSYLLRPTRHIAARDLVPAMMIGFAGNNLLPLRLGELIRIYALCKEQNLAKSTILGTVVLERVFDIVSMLILLTTAMYAIASNSSEIEAARSFTLITAIVAVAGTYGVAKAPPWLVTILRPLFRSIPKKLRPGVQARLYLLQLGFAVLTQSPGRVFLKIALNSLVQWALLAICILLSIMAFDITVSPAAPVLILGIVVAGISLPTAPGFVGTIEYCFVLGLGLFGIGAEQAFSVGIYYHVITFFSVTLAGALYIRKLNTTFGNIAKNATDIKTGDK